MCNIESNIYFKDLAQMAGVHRVTLWRWLRQHRHKLEALGYRRGRSLPDAVVRYICDWFVILPDS